MKKIIAFSFSKQRNILFSHHAGTVRALTTGLAVICWSQANLILSSRVQLRLQSCTRTERSEWSSVHCTFLRMENMSSIQCITYPAIDCIWPLIPFAVNPAKSSRYEQRSARQPGQAGSPLQAPSPTRKNVVRKNHTSWADLMKQAIHLKHASTQHQHGVYQCLFICLRHANAYMSNSYHRPTTSVAITIPESYHKRDKIH